MDNQIHFTKTPSVLGSIHGSTAKGAQMLGRLNLSTKFVGSINQGTFFSHLFFSLCATQHILWIILVTKSTILISKIEVFPSRSSGTLRGDGGRREGSTCLHHLGQALFNHCSPEKKSAFLF